MASTPKLHQRISLNRLSTGKLTPLRAVAYGAMVATPLPWLVEVAFRDDDDVAAASCGRGGDTRGGIDVDIMIHRLWALRMCLCVTKGSRYSGSDVGRLCALLVEVRSGNVDAAEFPGIG